MQPEQDQGNGEAENKLNDLAVGHQHLPRGSEAEATEKIVRVHQHMDAGVGEESDNLQGLGGFKPEEAHEDDKGVMEDMEEGEGATFEEKDEGIEEFIVFREVEGVRPEEDRARGRGRGGEAEEPKPGRRCREGGNEGAKEDEEGREEEN